MLGAKELSIVDNFKYLGSQMASSKADFNTRRGQAYSAFEKLDKIWSAKHVPLHLKTGIFEASVVSILLYGCESWVIDEELEKQINSFATTCYRSLLGIKWCDHVSNEKVLEKVKKAPLIDTVRKRQLEHTLRLDDREPLKTLRSTNRSTAVLNEDHDHLATNIKLLSF